MSIFSWLHMITVDAFIAYNTIFEVAVRLALVLPFFRHCMLRVHCVERTMAAP